jgi:hypothetical protein
LEGGVKVNVEEVKALLKEGIRTGQSLPLLQARRLIEEGDLPDGVEIDVVKNICVSMKHGNVAQLNAAIRMLDDYAATEAAPKAEDAQQAPEETAEKKAKKRGKKTKKSKKRKA